LPEDHHQSQLPKYQALQNKDLILPEWAEGRNFAMGQAGMQPQAAQRITQTHQVAVGACPPMIRLVRRSRSPRGPSAAHIGSPHAIRKEKLHLLLSSTNALHIQ
jgi:hypothetical protein